MAQIPGLSGREAARAFERVGNEYHHHTGSHMIYYRSDGKHLSIPDHRELGRGILRRLIRLAGLSVQEFVGLL